MVSCHPLDRCLPIQNPRHGSFISTHLRRGLQYTNRCFLSLDLVQSIDPDGNGCISHSWDLLVLGVQTRILWRRIGCFSSHSTLPRHLSNIIDISSSQIDRWPKSKLFLQLPIITNHSCTGAYLNPVGVQRADSNGIESRRKRHCEQKY